MRMNIRNMLLLSFAAVLLLTAVVGIIGYNSSNTINNLLVTLYTKQTQAISTIQQAKIDFLSIRVAIRQAVLENDQNAIETQLQKVTDGENKVRADLAQFEPLITSDQARASLTDFSKAFDSYAAAVEKIASLALQNKDSEAITAIADAATVTTQTDQDVNNLVSLNQQQAKDFYQQSTSTFAQSQTLLIVLMISSLLIGVGIAVFIARNMANSLKLIRQATENMAVGNLNRDMSEETKESLRRQKNEIGDVARALTALRIFMTEMTDAAKRIAAGDLTMELQPKSDNDELGIAFSQMIVMLREMTGRIAGNASALASASQQLASAADQSGLATSQIATTIQQVARGASQQTESVTHTAASIEQMSHAIEGIAKGAQEQSKEINRAAEITQQIAGAIQQVTCNAEAGVKGSGQAAQAAKEGARTVSTTIQGMLTIQDKVAASAQKVQEMGARSGQIGMIVETIDDIASQTNLLALNAAIEAARAGEHGKGFAVVADEVRKLAERSSGATKEIGGLVKEIQNSVVEAVAAMQAGSVEVESGVAQANQAGQALKAILDAVENVNQQVGEIAKAARQMSELSNELVAATDSVSAVVEENTAATEEMSAGSSEVTQAIENIASVSEENSAAAEEVSASSEEMSAQVEEVSASAKSLEEMAKDLQKFMSQFKLA